MKQHSRFSIALALAAAMLAAYPPAGYSPGAQVCLAAPEADPDISVKVDGLEVVFDVNPRIVNDRIVVPFRQVAEALGARVEWIPQTRKVVAAGDSGAGPVRMELITGQPVAYVNGVERPLDVSPVIVDGRVLVPLRFFSESLGCRVDWNAAARTAIIESPPARMEVYAYYALGDERTSSWKDLFGEWHPWFSRGLSDIVSNVGFGWYSLEKDGALAIGSRTGFIRPAGWEKALDATAVLGVGAEMMVFAGDGDGGLTSFLASAPARAKAIEAIRVEVAAYDGVNLDFEGLGMTGRGDALDTVRDAFTGFAEELSAAIRPLGKRLTLTVHPPNGEYRGYDYAALGRVADRLIVMAYGYGDSVAPEPVEKALEAVQGLGAVPREKVILGVSVAHEDAAGIRSRIGVARRYGLAGVALWRLGLLDDSHEAALRARVRSRIAGPAQAGGSGASGTAEGGPSQGPGDAGDSRRYRLLSPFGLAGYGGYQVWVPDLDADGRSEIIVQAVAGEREGQAEEPPVYCAIHEGFNEVWRGEGLRVNAVVDVTEDGKPEIICGDGRVYAYTDRAVTLLEKDGDLLRRYREDNFLPRRPAEVDPGTTEHILDLDRDGSMDRLTVKADTGVLIESKVKEAARLDAGGAVREVLFPRLKSGSRSSTAILTVASAGTESSLVWRVWSPRDSGTTMGYRLAWEGAQDASRVSEYDAPPAYLAADLDGDGVDELVTNRLGTIQVFVWDGARSAFELKYTGPDNGGLGFSQFAAADLDGDGRRELVARHITPTLYHNDLKIYKWSGEGLEGLADIKDIGWYASIPPVPGDFLGTGREQVLLCTNFELCRPSVLTLNADPPAPGGP
ncbi:MAG: stalk domain-containing protein [Ignavibacteriales bacterium]